MRTRVIYTTFEQVVIALYNRGVLTLELLDTLALAYRGMEVDSAGSANLRARDGKDLPQACITLINPAFALVGRGDRGDDEEYWETELKEWSHITNARWGWS